MIDEQEIKELLAKTTPFFKIISKKLGRGFKFEGSAIANEQKEDVSIKIENHIKI